MAFLLRYKFAILFSICISLVYFVPRLLTLTNLPIFTDEAIYLRWAQIAKNDAAWRFIALTDGKQPLYIWLVMSAMKFVTDPLTAGRVISVFAGFATMVGLFFLGREVFKNYLYGLVSAGLYSIYSFSLVYDRMALYDGLVGTFFLWGCYFAVLLGRTLRLDVALITGMIAGAAVLNKTSGFFNVALIPLSIILIPWQKKQYIKTFLKATGLLLLIAAMAVGFYSILRLSPFYHIIEEKNALFVYPIDEWIKHPFLSFAGNLFVGMQDWFFRYVTFPFAILILASFVIDRNYTKQKLVLFLWFFIPFMYLAFFGHRIYPRYIFFMTLPLLPLVGYSLIRMREMILNRYLYVFVIVLTLSLQLRSDFMILFDFPNSPIPYSDVSQYNNSWPSGTGVKESIELFKKEAEKGKIFIATEGTFGLMPYAYEIYLDENPNIEIKGYYPIGADIPQEVIEKSKQMTTYFVFYQGCYLCKYAGLAPTSWTNASLVLQIPKFQEKNYLSVYQIHP